MVELSAQSPAADFSVSEAWRFEEAVNMALVACEAVSPYDRFRLIETPDENFLLVTNVIPRESAEVPVLDSSSSGGDSGPEDKRKTSGIKPRGKRTAVGLGPNAVVDDALRKTTPPRRLFYVDTTCWSVSRPRLSLCRRFVCMIMRYAMLTVLPTTAN